MGKSASRRGSCASTGPSCVSPVEAGLPVRPSPREPCLPQVECAIPVHGRLIEATLMPLSFPYGTLNKPADLIQAHSSVRDAPNFRHVNMPRALTCFKGQIPQSQILDRSLGSAVDITPASRMSFKHYKLVNIEIGERYRLGSPRHRHGRRRRHLPIND